MGVPLADIDCDDGPIWSLAFGETDEIIYFGGAEGTIGRWDRSGTHEGSFEQLDEAIEGNATSIATDNSTSRLLVGFSSGMIHVYAIPDGHIISTHDFHDDLISGIAPHPTSPEFIAGSYDGDVTIWQSPTDGLRIVLEQPHESAVTGVCWSGAADIFATAGVESEVLLWDSNPIQLSNRVGGTMHTVVALGFVSPTDELVTVDYDGNISIVDPETGDVTLTARVGEQGEYQLAIAPTGNQMAIGTNASVNVYDTSSGRLIDYHRFSHVAVCSVAYSSTGDVFGVGTDVGTIKLFDSPSPD